MNTRV